MDLISKSYLAFTLNCVAGGCFFMFAAGFAISLDSFMPWAALAGSVVFKIAGSAVEASAETAIVSFIDENLKQE